jgi:predicted nuclease with TOPRIM domain
MSSKKSPKADKKVKIGGVVGPSKGKEKEGRAKKTAAEYTITEEYSMPDVTSIGAKYDVHVNDKDADVGAAVELDSDTQKAVIASIGNSSGLVSQNRQLVDQITAKNKENEKLRVLLEACELPPGTSVEKFQRILVSGDDACDYRDAKIVSLAKKVRGLTVSLNKSRASSETYEVHILELQRKSEGLQRELSAVLASRQHASSGRTQRVNGGAHGVSESTSKTENDMRRDLSTMQKSNDELRRKLTQSTEDVKNLTSALKREVGDGISLEQAVDGGWRGRAQQIIMLKNKIKRLEGQQGATRGTGSSQQPDVDTRAQEDIAGMMLDRKQAVEGIIEERAKLQEHCEQLEGKQRALRARIRTLESDCERSKQQVQVLLQKNNTDDQLIDALKKELGNVRNHSQSTTMKSRMTNETAKHVVRRVGNHSVGSGNTFGGGSIRTGGNITEDESSETAELHRLRRLCRQQAEQLTTQDEVIKRLRASAEKF